MKRIVIVNEIYDYFSLNLAFTLFEKNSSYILKFNKIFYSKIIKEDKYKIFLQNSLAIVFDLTGIFIDSKLSYEILIVKSQENLPKSKPNNYVKIAKKEIIWIQKLLSQKENKIVIIDTKSMNNSELKIYKENLQKYNIYIDKIIVIPFVYNQYESSMDRTVYNRLNTALSVFKEWIISRVPNFFEENEILLYVPKKSITYKDCNLFELISQIKSVYWDKKSVQINDMKEYDYIKVVAQLAKDYAINLSITLDKTKVSKIDRFLFNAINFYAYPIFSSKTLPDKFLQKNFDSEINIGRSTIRESEYIEENSRLIDKNGNILKFFDGGEGELIIIVNAFGVEINAWSKVIQELKNNYRIIVWKIRGLWDNELNQINKKVYDLKEQVEDIERIFKYSNEKKVHIISWCSGVKAAALFCQKHKDNILSFSCFGGEFAPFRGSEPYHSKFRQNVNLICHLIDEDKRMLHFYKKIINQGVFNKPLDNYSVDKVEYIYEIIPERFKNLLLGPFSTDETMINFLNMCSDYYKTDLTEVLRYMDFPILLLTADCDQVSPYQQSLWASKITQYSYYIKFPCSSHYFILERPKEVVEALYFIFTPR